MTENEIQIKPFLEKIVNGHRMTEDEAYLLFELIMTGGATDAQIACVLTAIECRFDGPEVDEIVGAARAMRRHVRRVDIPEGIEVVDTCGTGGDGTRTFNISTTAALITAGAGIYVAKHGNRSVTSSSGSSQVLEELGLNLQLSDAALKQCIEEARFCFCFAPAHHPAMKHAITARKEMGIKTLFNILGPLTNPAGAKRQVIGVFSADFALKLAEALQRLGAEQAMVVHGNGLDELTTAGPSHIAELRDGKADLHMFDAQELGLPEINLEEIKVGTPQHSAEMIMKVLDGEKHPARDIAALNAAAAILVSGKVSTMEEGLAIAYESIDSGNAKATLEKLCAISQG